ncbi:hypothetical protein [Vulcaniibacterium tengchongense]|uniref:PsiF repeat-containing protein n=1 Tax=Vulcaniibacterium tengchongense TaxID=1273429 RepID=A0A3N4V865_9GAMM|nr:hypothetical protein [Vulcaniibacterium tengchongense]RPE75901.1 hypothetical protein EDC50_2802 [Vulcaniibacterium tengchongense]
MSRPASRRARIAAPLTFALAGLAGAQPSDAPPAPKGPEFRAALEACFAEQGLPPPEPGQPRRLEAGEGKRPDRQKLDACLRGKGFAPPPRRGPPQEHPPQA